MKVVYPGSFDPITYGHLDIIERLGKKFDEVVVLISSSAQKKYIFDMEQRKKIAEKICSKFKNITIDSWDGLLVDYLKKNKIDIIAKGLRNSHDYEYEVTMDHTNKTLLPNVENIYLISGPEYSSISSTLVKEIAYLQGDLSKFVPPEVSKEISKALKQKNSGAKKMILSNRTKKLKSSPTLELAAIGRKLKSEGHDVISLAVGEPDWDSFEVAKQEAIASIEKGFTKYVPSNGIEELRKAIAETTKRDLGVTYSPEQVTVTTGGKFSIFAFLQIFLNKNDEVLIPAPYWVSYPDMTELAEGKPVFVSSTEKSGFKISGKDLEDKITKNTKIFILNSPSNPTGSTYTEAELKSLADVLKRHPDVYILCDDIYNRLVFSPKGLAPHLLHVAPELQNRVVIINGGSKSYSMTGWRIGWAIGPQEIISAMTKYQSQSVSCAASFVQRAAFKAIVEGDKELKEVQRKLLERKNFAVEEASKVKNISCYNPDGAFYLWINVEKCLNKKYKGKDIKNSRDFAYTLLEEQKVVTVPGIEFGMEGYIRLSFAIEPKRMTEAFRRMDQFIHALQ